jgi:hypothetical protein
MDEPEKVSATTLLSHQLSAEKHFFFRKTRTWQTFIRKKRSPARWRLEFHPSMPLRFLIGAKTRRKRASQGSERFTFRLLTLKSSEEKERENFFFLNVINLKAEKKGKENSSRLITNDKQTTTKKKRKPILDI